MVPVSLMPRQHWGMSLDDISGACGVDTLTLGGTKNGLMGAECVVIFNQDLIKEARYARKQSCQLASKMRYISCQFTAFLEDNLWLTCAQHANAMAQRLYKKLSTMPDIKFTPNSGEQPIILHHAAWKKKISYKNIIISTFGTKP